MEKSKKKFKDTRVGKFLSKAAPNILKGVSDLVPDAGILKLVGGLISKDEVLTPKDKEEALKLLELDIIEIQEISKRWSADMSSDSWLSKNTRPMTLITVDKPWLYRFRKASFRFGENIPKVTKNTYLHIYALTLLPFIRISTGN